jgi:hypothetical protein
MPLHKTRGQPQSAATADTTPPVEIKLDKLALDLPAISPIPLWSLRLLNP